jgi:hypothetical protein
MATPVQVTGIQSTGTGTSLPKAFTSNVTTGNTIIALIAWYKATAGTPAISSVQDTLGNSLSAFPGTFKRGVSDTLLAVEIWYKTGIIGGASTITVTASASSFISFGLIEVSGQSLGSIEDQKAVASGTSTAPATGSFTNVLSGITVAVVDHDGADTTIPHNSGAGFSLIYRNDTTANTPICAQYKVTLAGAINPSWTLGASRNWTCAGAGFKDRVSSPLFRRSRRWAKTTGGIYLPI